MTSSFMHNPQAPSPPLPGGTLIYGIERYVLPDRVWFLLVSILKYVILFALVGVVFPM